MSLLRELAHKNDKTIIVVAMICVLKEEVDKVYQIIDGKMSKIDGKFSDIKTYVIHVGFIREGKFKTDSTIC